MGPVVAELWQPYGSKNTYDTGGHAYVALVDKWPWCCTSTGQNDSNELDLEWISPVVAELWHLQSLGRMNRWTNGQKDKRKKSIP